MPNTLTLSAFARQVGLSQGRVSQLVREGLPVDSAGRVDPERGRRWIDERLDPARREAEARGRGAASPRDRLGTVADIRAQKLMREAKLLDIELRRKTGEVVDRAEAERAIFARARQERDAWLAFASRASAALSSAGIDPARSFPILDRIVREQLAELADTPLKL